MSILFKERKYPIRVDLYEKSPKKCNFLSEIVKTLNLNALVLEKNVFRNLISYIENKEIIVVDDNSSDGTYLSCKAAFEKNDILFIFPHQIKFFQKKTFDISIGKYSTLFCFLCNISRMNFVLYDEPLPNSIKLYSSIRYVDNSLSIDSKISISALVR